MATTGRKRLYEDPLDVYNVRLTAAQARKGRRYGKGGLGKGLRSLLDQSPWPEDGEPACHKRRSTDR